MARPLRIEFPGALYCVSARGRGGRPVFLTPEDGEGFLEVLGQVARRFDWCVYAYCLLPNRYRLVVQTRAASLSEGMRRLGGLATQAFNRRHGARGPLFQGRFKAVLVERDAYLAQVCRDVLRGPVEAGLAGHPRDWRWSSCRATEMGKAPDWLDRDGVLARFGADPTAAARAFTDFVAEDASDERMWAGRRGQIFLGSADFAAETKALAAAAGAAVAVPKPLSWYGARYPDRHEAMARAHLEGGYAQPEVARHFVVHFSTVSRAAARLARAKAA
ncbi:MAG: hypothetical protein V3S45_08095 [Kiloniellales bacterium]